MNILQSIIENKSINLHLDLLKLHYRFGS